MIQGIIDLHHDLFFFLLCFTLILIYLMESSSGQKRGRISSIVEASSSASATPGDEDPRKKKVRRQDADGKDGFRSEPPINGAQPGIPSISFLRKRIQSVLRSCRNRKLHETLLESIYEDLHLETASAEKRVKIAQILEDIYRRSQYLRSNQRDKPHIDLIVQICDWERDHLRKRNSLV